MGLVNSSSRLERELGATVPEDKYFGLDNFGNTCYCNSVLQSLFFCRPFRECVLQYYQDVVSHKDEETLLSCLAELFTMIVKQKRKSGSVAPKRFIAKLRRENELFAGYMHHDAHEFFNYLINTIAEILVEERKSESKEESNPHTWIHDIFEGVLSNEMKCLCCETVTTRDESFLDLSVDVEQNTSVTSCLRKFSATETLKKQDKFFCETCCSLQEAEKRMLIKRLPRILALHLKRFKFMEHIQRHRKLSYRVPFPMEIRLPNTVDNVGDEKLYRLFSIVVHIGSGPSHGHYVAIVKSGNRWVMFDDEAVELFDESQIPCCFGSTQEFTSSSETGYILYYESVD